MKQRAVMTLAVLALTAPALAQDQSASERRAVLEAKLQVERARATVESRVITGAPYSGEAVTETTQTLGDGNRIARKSVTRIYRDSDGRTRRETISTTGDVVSINISDPVAESQYVLDPRAKTAHRNGVIMMGRGGFASASVTPGGSGVVVATRAADGNVSVRASDPETRAKQEAEVAAGAASAGARGGGGGGGVGGGRGRGGVEAGASVSPMIAAPAMAAGSGKINKEDLGTQIVEGVMATGSRTTLTIEAGAIGNVQPIHVISEQWYSEDLKVLIMTRHSDPRTGDTTYRLTNVNLAEPQRALFEVPSDYTLRDSVIRRENPLK
jgi:hypothetical protein